MSRGSNYDVMADVYDAWVASVAAVTEPNRRFYVEECAGVEGLACELGVGNGRITIGMAQTGVRVAGVDDSAAMLELCRTRAEEAGVADRITLIRADFRDFELPESAELVTIPFHSIGHMTSLEDKRECLAHIHGQLAPGGRLVFDHFVFDEDLARSKHGVPQFRTEYVEPDDGLDAILWICTNFDFSAQTMRVIATSEMTDEAGDVVRRRVRRLNFSWIDPDQTHALLEETGYMIEAAYGDFDRAPLDDGSHHQIWVARRP